MIGFSRKSMRKLHELFGTTSLKGLAYTMPKAILAAGFILQYLEYTHHTKLGHLQGLSA